MSMVFPPFRLDLSSEQLWREDQVIALRPKTFAVLRYLVEQAGKLVTKDELLDAVWAGTIVSDTVLKSCIRELREALGDDVQAPQYIATVHRRGYRFIGPLSSLPKQSPAPTETGHGPGAAAGTKLARKLSAILSADVQGYSRLMGEDEEATIRTLTAYREVMTLLIHHHRGRVVDSPGDNLLAEFASAVDAVQGAVAIQQALQRKNAELPAHRRMQYRIGINVGDVLSEGERLYGDGVNIAARLEALAEGGGLCISGTVYDQVKNKVGLAYEYLGEQLVKNIAEPVRVYRVRWETDGESAPLPTPTPPVAGNQYSVVSRQKVKPIPIAQYPAPVLVGREAELSQLVGYWRKALDGARHMVFVTGEPGIGKTTLVEAFLRMLDAQGQEFNEEVWIGRGQCIEQYGAGEAYMPVLEALGRLCREPGGDRLIALLHQRAPTWLVQMPTLLDASALETLQRKVHGATRERMLREMGEAVDALTSERPLVLWLEDLHWSDPSTLELLALLARRREPARLLIVGTYRPVDVIVSEHLLRTVKQELQLHGHCQELAVRLLSEEAVEEYLAVRFDADGEERRAAPLPSLAHTIHQRTEGNPLFMVNIVDNLLAEEQLDRAGVEINAPPTIREMIERQLERLSSKEQQMLEVASVAGMEFSAAAVAPGTDTTVDEAEQQCAALARRGQFLQGRGTGEWPDRTVATRYGFLHALYQEVTYERIPAGRRVALHQRIGKRLEAAYGVQGSEIAAELAVHFERGREYQKAILYLQQAGELASKRLALREAIAHLNQGIKIVGLLQPSPERDGRELDLRIALGMAWLGLKGWTASEVWTSLHPALALAKSLGHRTALLPIYYGLWNHVDSQGRIAESLDWIHDMLITAEAEGDVDLLIVAHRAACDTYFWRGDFTQSRVHGEQVLALYDEEQHHYVADLLHGDPKSKVGMYMSFDTWMLGYPDRAVQESEAAVTHARRRGHPFDLGWMLASSSIVWACRRAPEQILARTEEAERLGRAHDLPFISDVLAQHWKGVAWLQAGRLAEGIRQVQGMLEIWNAHGAEIGMPCFRAVLAEGLALSGDIVGGLRLLEESLTQIARSGWEERWYLAEVLRLKGWMLTLQGDLAGAEQQYLASLDWAREQQAKSWELRASTSLARLWRQQGKKKEAHKLLAEVYGWFTEGFDTADLKEAKALLEALSH